MLRIPFVLYDGNIQNSGAQTLAKECSRVMALTTLKRGGDLINRYQVGSKTKQLNLTSEISAHSVILEKLVYFLLLFSSEKRGCEKNNSHVPGTVFK